MPGAGGQPGTNVPGEDQPGTDHIMSLGLPASTGLPRSRPVEFKDVAFRSVRDQDLVHDMDYAVVRGNVGPLLSTRLKRA